MPWLLYVARKAGALRGARASLAIAALLLAAAAYTLPIHLFPRAVQLWQMPAGISPLRAGTDLPVFCMPPGGIAIRCGSARVRSNAAFAFTSFGGTPDHAAAMPVLAEADIGLLWALADPESKAKTRVAATRVEQQLIAVIRDITQSETWQREYREPVRLLFKRIADAAWNAPNTQRAFRMLVRAIEPLVARRVGKDIGPAIAPYMADAAWTLIESNSTRVFSLILGDPADFSGLAVAFTAALADPEVQRLVGRLGPEIMALPQMELLSECLLSNAAEIAERDPDVIDLLTGIATDRRLGRPLGDLRGDIGVFIRQAGQALWGLGSNRSLNSLAGVAVKSTIPGASQPLILLLDPDDAATLARTLPGNAVLLVPKAPE